MITKNVEDYLRSEMTKELDLCKLAMDLMIYVDKILKMQYIKDRSFDDPVFITYAKTSVYDEIEANLDSGTIRNGLISILRSQKQYEDFRIKSLQVLYYISCKTDAKNDLKLLADIDFINFSEAVKISSDGFKSFLEE